MSGRTVLVLLATGLLAVFPSETLARDPLGTYVVSACRAGERPAPLAGWYPEVPGARPIRNTCAQDGAFGISNSGAAIWKGFEYYRWFWDAPEDVVVAGVRLWRTVAVPGNSLGYWFHAGNTEVEGGFSVFSGVQPVENLKLSATRLSITYGCASVEGCFFFQFYSAAVVFYRVEMILRDLVAPEPQGAAGGSLLEGRPLAGTVAIATNYRDRGGGLLQANLLVDGERREGKRISGSSCAQPYTTPTPCPLSGRVEIGFDTRSVDDGKRRVALELVDVAGNRALVGPYTVVVKNNPDIVPVPDAAPQLPGRLSMDRAVIRSRFGARVAIAGRVVDLDDQPIAGARIDIASKLRMHGSAFSAAASVVSDSRGRFSVRVEPGPSRVYRFRYVASEATTELLVTAPVRLTASPRGVRNGQFVAFSGRVRGSGSGTTRVELQAQAGRRWIPFRTVALRNGRFKARYRFRNTIRTSRYRFRAVVHADAEFPYARARSRIVTVLVRP
jgi:hypothetical protein